MSKISVKKVISYLDEMEKFNSFTDNSVNEIIEKAHEEICLNFVKSYIKNVLEFKMKNIEQEEFYFELGLLNFEKTKDNFECIFEIKFNFKFFNSCQKYFEDEDLWTDTIQLLIIEKFNDVFFVEYDTFNKCIILKIKK